MSKRLAALIAIVLMAAIMISAASADEIWYVYTENRGTLNVRSTPNGERVGVLNYGAAVDVIHYSSMGWSKIFFENSEFRGEAYVMSRYLTRTKPGTTPSGGGSVPTDTSSVDAMNREFRSAQKVSPFTIVSRPTRSTGWVNLRWGPSEDTERITTCYQGKELTVLAVLSNWYQVQDPSTGMVGFISRKYVSIR